MPLTPSVDHSNQHRSNANLIEHVRISLNLAHINIKIITATDSYGSSLPIRVRLYQRELLIGERALVLFSLESRGEFVGITED